MVRCVAKNEITCRKRKGLPEGRSEKFPGEKEAGTVNQTFTRNHNARTDNATRNPHKACAVGDVRREASVEKCYWIEVGKRGNTAYLRGRKMTTEVERMVGAWVEFS